MSILTSFVTLCHPWIRTEDVTVAYGMWAKQEPNSVAIRLRFLVAGDHFSGAGRQIVRNPSAKSRDQLCRATIKHGTATHLAERSP